MTSFITKQFTDNFAAKRRAAGGFDFGASDCRSARRHFFGNHPALTDWNLGFRVVLVTGP